MSLETDNDVGVVQAGEDLGLSPESGKAIRVRREDVWEDLQRDLALNCVSCACQTWPMPPSSMSVATLYEPSD